MKKNLTRTLMLTAAVLAAGAAAYAQVHIGLNATIPFSFKMNGKTLSAGTYRLGPATMSNSNVLYFRGVKASVYAIGTHAIGDDQRARLMFRCGDSSGCALTEVWDGQGQGWKFAAPRLSAAEKERLAVVYMSRTTAD